jgi:hypothetical protein
MDRFNDTPALGSGDMYISDLMGIELFQKSTGRKPSPGEMQKSNAKGMPMPEVNSLANNGSFHFNLPSSAIKDKFVNHTENHREKRVITDLNQSGLGKSQ